jgi:hypothetical protein
MNEGTRVADDFGFHAEFGSCVSEGTDQIAVYPALMHEKIGVGG